MPNNESSKLQGTENVEMRNESVEIHQVEGAELLHAGHAGGADSQVEGPVSLNDFGGLDAGFEAAFSKSLDNLDLFSKDLDFSESNDELLHDRKAGKGTDEDSDDDDDTDDDDIDVESASDKVLETDATVTATTKKGTRREHNDSPGDVSFLDTSKALESDAAVASISAAKAGTKKGGAKTASKKKTSGAKKAKASKSANSKGEPQMTKQEMLNSLTWSKEPRWFFLQVKPGCEQSCALSIRNMARSLQDLQVKEVLVPATKIMRLTKGGQSVKKEERIFPGYILVLMVMNQQNYSDVQRVPNVQWFMGDPNRDKASGQPFRPPLPVTDAEMKVVFDKVKEAGSVKPEKKTSIRPGNSIEVLSGPFAGNRGRVMAVKPHLDIVSVRLLMVGHGTPVEFEMDQVKVVKDIPEDGEEQTDNQSADLDKGPLSEEGSPHESASGSRIPAVKAGSKAGVASAADDLAALLGDDRPDADDDFSSLFGKEEEAFNFLDADDKGKASKRRIHEQKTARQVPLDIEDEFSTLFGDEDESFSFLDSDGKADGRETVPSVVENRENESSKDPLISSDADLTSFLSVGEKPSPSENRNEAVDDLFDFLDSDDEFEEASIIPDSTEEPSS